MKRVRCPKCDHYLYFNEKKYEPGQSLVFVCDECGKQFRIRLGKSSLKSTRKDEVLSPDNIDAPFGYISIIENVFTFKQLIPLQEGENLIGRRSPGSSVTIPIETGDMSMDRRHTVIHVGKNKENKLVFTIWDNDSMTGTFLGADEILPGDKKIIEPGQVITTGATTFILYTKDEDNQ
ncbi:MULTISPECIES: FHA domain-containing protein [Bacteroides]|uniref:FHA domain-containing protein n=1 Tax=Bacteroides TaxID=816 RepID=UPI001D685F2D|nr:MULTISPECIES: FHA domain-containing protein [Bacteroides]HJD92995.1 FHA domain-containing protein [Bacteroides coprosuis]